MRRWVLVAICLLLAGAGTRSARADLRADELVLIVNRNEPAGVELAKFYARVRHVPDGRILSLDLPTTDDLPAHQYAREVVPAVRAFLHDRGLERQVRCLVPFYGVPLRIAGRQNTPAEAAEFTAAGAALAKLPERVRPAVEAVEAMARRLDPKFSPAAGQSLDELEQRWGAAAKAITAGLQTITAVVPRGDATRDFLLAAAPLEGDALRIQAGKVSLEVHPDRQATDGPPLVAAATAYQRAAAEVAGCAATPDDALARARLRTIFVANFGLLKYARLLRDQLDYLDERHGGQAFDSELALVEWPVHAHNYPGGSPYAAPTTTQGQRWFGNPLNYVHALAPHGTQAATLMVVRLDAATPDVVRDMIATSVRVEEAGLHGKIVIDSLGARPGQDPDGHPGFGPYEAMMRNLRDQLTGRPGVDLVFDSKPAVLPAHSVSDVALYCGWYSLGEYVPACAFANGAVAMHISSFAMVRVHSPQSNDWASHMLSDGAAATIGPVAEPYLFAFPHPDEFYPLLLTGRLTLAEVYWRTEAVASWQMACVGDPLYTPYKVDPVLQVSDLPARLRGLFGPLAVVSTEPAPAVKGSPPAGR